VIFLKFHFTGSSTFYCLDFFQDISRLLTHIQLFWSCLQQYCPQIIPILLTRVDFIWNMLA